MWFKKFNSLARVHLLLLFLLTFPSTAFAKTDSWSQVMLRATAYKEAGNCDAQWRQIWGYRQGIDSFSFLFLTGMAIFGVHPGPTNKHTHSKALAFQFAVISGLKGQILRKDQIEKLSSDEEKIGMELAVGIAREILLQTSMEESGRYYSPMFQSCLKQSNVKYCVKKYVSEKKINSTTFIKQLDEKLTHPDTRIECTNVDFK